MRPAAPIAIIRADASALVGGGHVVRCLALAEELAARGWRIAFCATRETFAAAPEAAAFPDSVALCQMDANDPVRMRQHWPDGVDLLVVDHYQLTARFAEELRTFARCIVCIDDFPTRDHACDMVVDTTLGRRAEDYAARLPRGARALCGADYALLRRPFRDMRRKGHSRVNDGQPLRAMVSLGLTDPDNATGCVLNAAAGLVETIDIVVGSAAPHRRDLERVAASHEGWRVHTQLSAAAMAQCLSDADIVFGAAGSSAYERCCLGRPMLLLQTADNQSGNLAALVSAGVARSLGIFGAVSERDVRQVIAESLSDRAGLDRMGKRGASLVDGRGVHRVADAIEAMRYTG